MLLINNFGSNLGFYMLLPYVAKHMTGGLGMAPAFAGFVMGFRMFSQQGMFLVGGTLADRFNYRTVIMAGCALRIAGFALFAVAQGPLTILAAAFLSGFAGALFTPASQALMARLTEGRPERESIYALQNMTSEIGAFCGPLAGLFLLGFGFTTVGLSAALVFFVLLLLQGATLPRTEGAERGSSFPVWEDWKAVFARKDFVLFCLWMSFYYFMYNQLYVLLPLSVPNDASVASVFIVTAVLSSVLQMPVSRWAQRLLSRPQRLGTGLALMALSFVFLQVPSIVVFTIPSNALVTAAFLTLGSLLVFPPALSMVPELGGERRQGVCYGVFYLFAGIAGAAGGGATAWLWTLNPRVLVLGIAFVGLVFAFLLWRHINSVQARASVAARRQ